MRPAAPEVIVTEILDPAPLDELRRDYAVHYDPELYRKPDELARLIAGVPAIVVRNRTQVRGAVLAAADRLKLVARLGVGLDNIDLEGCAAQGIEVCAGTGANADSVAEFVMAMLLILVRGPQVFRATGAVVDGSWPRVALTGTEVKGRRLGIVGLGHVGSAVAVRARAFGLRVGAFDPYLQANDPAWDGVQRMADLAALLAASDVVSVNTPLTPETRGMIDRAAIARMKPGAILINTARGGLVDEDAVAEALEAGRLGGAALDVFDDEPVPAGRGARFRDTPNLILKPHIAGWTTEANDRIVAIALANVRRVLGPRR